MAKVDLKKEYQEFYKPTRNPLLVRVPAFNYLAVDGKGNPNDSQEFSDAVEALYGLAFAVKFLLKLGPEAFDYTVMPLEGQWWAEDMENFGKLDKDEWLWTMSVLQPDQVAPAHVETAREQVRKKKNPTALDKVRLERFEDGLSAQVLHVGPYSQEGPTIELLHRFIRENGHELCGKHRRSIFPTPAVRPRRR